MTKRPPKPKKIDFDSMQEFLRASAAWAEQWNVWPWGGPADEDDGYVFELANTKTTDTGSVT